LPAPITRLRAIAAMTASPGPAPLAATRILAYRGIWCIVHRCRLALAANYIRRALDSPVYYPRSFPKFIVLGFVLVCAPLVYALVELAMNLDLLAKQSEQAVVQAARVGQASRQVREQTTALERVVRQYLILDDPGLLDDYARVRHEFFQTTRALAGAAQDETTVVDINKLIVRESKLYQKLATPGRTPDTVTELADGYANLAEETQAVLNTSIRVTEQAVDGLRQTAREGRENWTLLGRGNVRDCAGAGAHLHLPRRAADPPDRRRDSPDRPRRLRPPDRRQWTSATCSIWGSGSNGCANAFTISKRSRTSSCAMCRMS
jgi:hypothetical protein